MSVALCHKGLEELSEPKDWDLQVQFPHHESRLYLELVLIPEK